MSFLSSPFVLALNWVYVLLQYIIIFIFKPYPPRKSKGETKKPYGRVAVIGAGITGISSAAHAISHNFDVTIYEAHSKEEGLGGIWANVNSTSGLQLNSLLYRFFPGVLWKKAFPKQKEIVGEIEKIWKEYDLESRTLFNTTVNSVRRVPNKEEESDSNSDSKHQSAPTPALRHKWLINDGAEGEFDAVIVTVGSCGEPKWIEFDGMSQRTLDKVKNSRNKKAKNDKNAGNKDKHDPARQRIGYTSSMAPGTPSYAAAASPEVTTSITDTSSQTEDDGEPSYAAVAAPEVPTHVGKKAKHAKGHSSDENVKTTHFNHTNQDGTFEKPVVHSSQLDKIDEDVVKDKTVVIVGSGASAVEAAETAIERRVRKIIIIARTDKWIIPRNIVIDTLIACQPFGREMPLSFIWEGFLKKWHYRGVKDLVPVNVGLFQDTPIVNDEFLKHVRSGKCEYVRGDPVRFTTEGIKVNVRERGTGIGEKGKEEVFDADVIVLATGFERPGIDFLEDDLFPEGYQRPDLYLQNFSTEDWSLLMTNSAYSSGIGTVGHFHIGIYTRILLTLLLDENARPSSKDMKLWVDVVRFLKRGASGGALGFFTYAELTIWLIGFHLLRPDRLRWLFFIMFGFGVRG